MTKIRSPKVNKIKLDNRERTVTVAEIIDRGVGVRRIVFTGAGDLMSPDASDKIYITPPQQDAVAEGKKKRKQKDAKVTPRPLPGGRLAIDVLRHPHGVLGSWVESVKIGDVCNITGPKESKQLAEEFDRMLIVADPAAITSTERRFAELNLPGELFLIGADMLDEPYVPENVRVRKYPSGAQGWLRASADLLEIIGDDTRTFLWCGGESVRVALVRGAIAGATGENTAAVFKGYWK